jgi:hypothetical protein
MMFGIISIVKTWSSGTEWAGFKPLAYTLSNRAWELPVTEVKRLADGSVERIPMTAGTALVRFRDESAREIHHSLSLHVKTDSSEYSFDGSSFNLQVLKQLISFEMRGMSAFGAQWFWYDSDSVTDDLHRSFSFFVVANDAIVIEDVHFNDHHESGFDPTVFDLPNFEKRIWFREPDWHEANVRYWYRRFYKETRVGQLMVLRPDEPPLFYYEEGRWTLPLAVAKAREYSAALKRNVWYAILLFILVLLLYRYC